MFVITSPNERFKLYVMFLLLDINVNRTEIKINYAFDIVLHSNVLVYHLYPLKILYLRVFNISFQYFFYLYCMILNLQTY